MVDTNAFGLAVLGHLADLSPERSAEASLRASSVYEQARVAHPTIDLCATEFAADLAARLCERPDIVAYFDALQVGDLYLACACGRGIDAAVIAFERLYGADLDRIARRFAGRMHCADDLGQVVREKLFVGGFDRRPRITEYSGFGYLQNWLRVTVTRTCLDQVKGSVQYKRESPMDSDDLDQVADPLTDLELDFLKREYRAEFKQAFRAALAALDSAERNVLRQHLVHGMSIDQIASIYHVHRATAARRLAGARSALLRATRRELMAALSINGGEFDSIMGLISSRLSASMYRLLGDDE